MHHHSVLALALAILNSSLVASQSSASASALENVIFPVISVVQTAQLDIMSGMAMPTFSSPPTLTSTPLAPKVTTPAPNSTPVMMSSMAMPAPNTTTMAQQMTRTSTVVMPTMSMSMPGMNKTMPTVTGGGEGRSVKILSLALGFMTGVFAFACLNGTE